MTKLTRKDLYSLEEYAERRPDIRREVMAHKQNRRISLGDHIHLLFEDRFTIHYQVQEMLRAERIFEAAGIEDELDAYNPLIPDGDNLKATMLIEYEDVQERQAALEKLIGVEDKVWVQIADQRAYAIADEDLERENETKTSSVHFLRFQFDNKAGQRLKAGAELSFGVDHEYYVANVVASDAQRESLATDFAE